MRRPFILKSAAAFLTMSLILFLPLVCAAQTAPKGPQSPASDPPKASAANPATGGGGAITPEQRLKALEEEVERLRTQLETANSRGTPAPAASRPEPTATTKPPSANSAPAPGQQTIAPKEPSVFKNPKFLEGVEVDMEFFYRFRGNNWGDLIALGRTDYRRTVGASDQLYEHVHNHFFNHRSFAALRLTLPKRWNANLEMDVAGSDFNDGAVMGNEPAGILGAAGMRRLSLDVRRFWLEYNGFARVQVGRLGMRFGNGILANVNRDGVRAFKPVNDKLTLIGVWFRGSEGSVLGESGGVSTDDKTGVQIVTNPRGDSAEDLNAFLALANITATKDHRFQLVAAKQIDGTFDHRQPEKFYFDANGSGAVGRSFTYTWEASYLAGQSPRSGVTRARLTNRAFLLFGSTFYKLPPGTLGGKLTFGVSSGLGSGDDNPNDDKQNAMQALFVDETANEYTAVYSDDIMGFNGSAASVAYTQGFANTRFVQPSVRIQLHRDVATRFTFTVLRAHKAQTEGLGPLGNGRFGVDPFLVFPATSQRRTKDIGHEVDVYLDYTLNKNILVFMRGGRFMPGAIFGAGTHDAFKVESGLEFKF